MNPALVVLGIGLIAVAVVASKHASSHSSPGPTQSPPSTAPVSRTSPPEFGYYANLLGDTNQFYDHVTYVWVNDFLGGQTQADIDWKNQQMISQIKEAKALGITKIVLSIGDLTFSAGYKKYLGVAQLVAFKKLLDAEGLTNMVIMLYPVDEPDLWGVSDAVMTQAIIDIKKVWPGPAVGVIYGANGNNMPGHNAFDWIGRDDYPSGVNVLNELPPLNPGQKWILVPGGASNPQPNLGPQWQQDPQPFFDFAMSHNEVAMIAAFIWQDNYDQKNTLGIHGNGMAPKYKAVGIQIKDMLLSVPGTPIPPRAPYLTEPIPPRGSGGVSR